MSKRNFTWVAVGSRGVKAWDKAGIDGKTWAQLCQTAKLPFIHRYVAAMPDAHFGLGSTVGSVIPTLGAIVPASVGVDIGCGMMACRTRYCADQLPDSLKSLRDRIERAVPHGRSNRGGPGDRGAWGEPPKHVNAAFADLKDGMEAVTSRTPVLKRIEHKTRIQLGTLGGGNHFVEVCLDENDDVWAMLHSGSRYPGNAIGQYFTRLAKKHMKVWHVKLPDPNLAYLPQSCPDFGPYMQALNWAQKYAWANRKLMMGAVMGAIESELYPESPDPAPTALDQIHCHHNYTAMEHHFGVNVWVTRKGAVRARSGDMGIIPGSMGARSFIVMGKGSADSFHSCSHGAGRAMSRTQAKREFTVEDHAIATRGVECRKDAGVLDETPGAYKDIDAVMEAQSDLVEIVHTLKQVVCVKG